MCVSGKFGGYYEQLGRLNQSFTAQLAANTISLFAEQNVYICHHLVVTAGLTLAVKKSFYPLTNRG